MKKFLLYITFLFVSANLWSQVTITETGGWLESAFVKWTPLAGVDSYNVYYTGGGQTDKKIDTQLIRKYGSYFRADVPGLAAGSYTIIVKPVTANVEGTGTTTGTITVKAHDRSGFAFEGGRVPGGYKADGTPKDGAVILYISQNTKNTIACDITTNNKGGFTNYVGLQNILYGIKKGLETRPFIIRLIGNITDMAVMEGGDVTIENSNNSNSYLTLEGVGDDAVGNGWGVRLKSASNIEVSNLGLMNCNSTAGDNIGMQQDNDHIWIHNNDLFYGNAGSDADQIKGDGAMDNKNSTYCTFSYNHFWDSGKASLLGLSEGTTLGLYVTYHHNWFDHSDSRQPRVRFYSAHIYNNYFDGNAKYGSGSTNGSSLFIEGNYYRNTKNPMMTSMQGTDVFDASKGANDYGTYPTFSKENGGTIKAYNNTFDTDIATNKMRFVAYGDPNPLYNITGKISSTVDFDAYLAINRSDIVPSTVKSFKGASTYNNFDTDPALYIKNLVIDEPSVARTKVKQYAGRVSGGDLKWVFNNSIDDKSYIVITGLKSAITDYATSMVSIQGETIPLGNQTLVATSNNNNQVVSTGVAIKNIVFTWGGDATDANVTGLPNGITATKNTTAKTVTLSGIPTETMEFTITTTGSAGISASDSGTITVMPPSTQILTCTTNNSSQSLTIGSAISTIIFTWSGDATDAEITALPDGLTATLDSDNKTITITGTALSKGSSTYTVTTSGTNGTPVVQSGIITISAVAVGNEIHNFTTSELSSTFYTITGSIATNRGMANYDNLNLTKCLKLETLSGIVTFTTTQPSTLTLVMRVSATNGAASAKINGKNYNDTSGIITISLLAGFHKIEKADTSNIFYIKTSYATLGINDKVQATKLHLYPNPAKDQLYFSNTDQKIKNVAIYNLTGSLIKTISNVVESVDVSTLNTGSYLVKVTTDEGTFTQKIIKK